MTRTRPGEAWKREMLQLAETAARKTHCIRGHEFTPENTYLRSDRPNPARACRECMRRRDRERYARRITQNP